MTFLPIRASLVALAAVASAAVAHAETGVVPPGMQMAQADSGSPQVKAVQKFLSNGQDVSGMDAGRLQQRLRRAQGLAQTPDLPPDLAQALQQQIGQMQEELARRQQGAGQQPPPPAATRQPPQLEQPPLPPYDPQQGLDAQQQKPRKHRKQDQSQDAQQQVQPQPEPQPQVQPVPQPGQPPQQAQQPAAPAGSPEVAAFLQTVRPASQLGPDALRQQMQRAMQLSQSPGLSPGQRDALRNVIRESRSGLAAGVQPPAQTPPPQQTQQQKPHVQQQTQQPAPGGQQAGRPGTLDPALERRAQAYLTDHADVQAMTRKQLRKRLSDIRDLLASNQLSPQTREALRQLLDRERMVLRSQVAAQDNLPPPMPQPGQQPPLRQQGQQPDWQQQPGRQQGGNGGGFDADIRIVLQDRRPPQQLDDRELVRRIDVYRYVVADDRYDEQQRMMWQRQMDDDRRYLRYRMMQERRQREAQLSAGGSPFNYEIEDQYDPRRQVPDDVFAAEAEDDEIAGVLAAPPRREIDRRYSLDDIERSPDLRDAVARIEIDTVHFGFGEGFLREEEIDKLDRIATVLEQILARHPDEVFLLEGHTDAVGSDQANLVLSRQRAEAVKQALVTYYVIPPQNLRTVGLGERYLKIPTDQPEAENRRVSLARITPLVGQAE